MTRRFLALATDYDGTIARHGDVDNSTESALRTWKDSGRKLLLVTGRELKDLERVCHCLDLFDGIVAENGAVLYWPHRRQTQILAPTPPQTFADCLRARGVTPLSFGDVIVATLESYKGVVLEAIEELNLNLRIILNKGAVMILPAGVDKATGLTAALKEMNLNLSEVIGVGDAENDQVFLSLCGYSVAVGNALPFLKKQVHFVTPDTHGAGVEHLIEKMIAEDVRTTNTAGQ